MSLLLAFSSDSSRSSAKALSFASFASFACSETDSQPSFPVNSDRKTIDSQRTSFSDSRFSAASLSCNPTSSPFPVAKWVFDHASLLFGSCYIWAVLQLGPQWAEPMHDAARRGSETTWARSIPGDGLEWRDLLHRRERPVCRKLKCANKTLINDLTLVNIVKNGFWVWCRPATPDLRSLDQKLILWSLACQRELLEGLHHDRYLHYGHIFRAADSTYRVVHYAHHESSVGLVREVSKRYTCGSGGTHLDRFVRWDNRAIRANTISLGRSCLQIEGRRVNNPITKTANEVPRRSPSPCISYEGIHGESTIPLMARFILTVQNQKLGLHVVSAEGWGRRLS